VSWSNFVTSPALKLGKEPLSDSNITAHPLITFPKLTYPYTFLRKALTAPERSAPRILTHWSLSTIVRMTENGFGIGVIPRLAILEEIKRGRLRVHRTKLQLNDFKFAVAYAQGSDEVTKTALASLAHDVVSTFMKGHRPRRPAKP
jgi:DNA-binding transcriptional LysR family regulator